MVSFLWSLVAIGSAFMFALTASIDSSSSWLYGLLMAAACLTAAWTLRDSPRDAHPKSPQRARTR
jgi:hypothetical protein